MFQLGKTIVSEDILEKEFVCNLSACKGACCVDGDAGAPLSLEETKILEEIYPKVKPFLRKEGIPNRCHDNEERIQREAEAGFVKHHHV